VTSDGTFFSAVSRMHTHAILLQAMRSWDDQTSSALVSGFHHRQPHFVLWRLLRFRLSDFGTFGDGLWIPGETHCYPCCSPHMGMIEESIGNLVALWRWMDLTFSHWYHCFLGAPCSLYEDMQN
jgi:hypothetical protein